ncbi:MAG: MoxR family ATPase [Thermoanaerobaculia bacterium]|nr:MoxR family ATPase [Thermoanaerobaculia bacterium]
MTQPRQQELHDRMARGHHKLSRLRQEIGRTVIGQRELVDRLLIALLIRGHILVEGLPGLAKTLAVKTLASAIDASFKRLQFTPDLLPADITGTLIYEPRQGSFTPRFGPIFANLVLADEVNRAPAKVQSALLEAMQERQVTIGETTHELPDPFVVIATQNPIEHEGTYTLPEAQVDRFVMKVVVDYPTPEDETEILGLYLDPGAEEVVVQKVMAVEDVHELTSLVARVHVDERLLRYIVDIVTSTRRPKEYGLADLESQLEFGASPRASIAFAHVTKAFAFMQGREYVVPEDVKTVAHDVLRHRLILTYEAAADRVTADQIVDRVLGTIVVP